MIRLGVVHLVWVPFGVSMLERFLNSYRRHPAGIDHELIVIFNGYKSREELAPFFRALEGVAFTPLCFDKPNQDLQSYYEAAEQITHDVVCFLNSYSQILADDWLRKLYDALQQPGVGLVGATGSWQRAHWRIHSRAVFMGYYPGRGPWLRPQEYACWARGWFQFWRKYYSTSESLATLIAPYPRFPNPHIRTTGFMLRRDLFLSLEHAPILSKEEAMRFESSDKGLTYQVQGRGLNILLVDKEGRAFAPLDWHLSHTYRQGTQSNLMISDNRTGEYADASLGIRRELGSGSWGRKARPQADTGALHENTLHKVL